MDLAPNYRDVNKDLTHRPELQAEMLDIRSRLSDGRPLPRRYYRAGIDRDEDILLKEMGVKHLHLGGMDSNVIVYLVEYPEMVKILQINDHVHLETRPRGKLLDGLFGNYLRKIETAAVAVTAGAAAATVVKVAKRRKRRRTRRKK